MPSSKTPSDLEAGPGRLPANVVSASSLIAPNAPSAAVEASAPAVIAVVASQVLTRRSSSMIVLVDARPFIQVVAGTSLLDTQTFTLNDGLVATVFEFNSTGGVTPGRIAVPFTSGDSAATVASAIVSAITGSGSGFVAEAHGSRVTVTNSDISKSVLITEAVANSGFTVRGSNTAVTITFPGDARPGDTITLIETTPYPGGVLLSAVFHDVAANERLSGSFGSRTYVCSDESVGWVAVAEKPGLQEVHATTTLVRSGTRQVVLCSTSVSAFTVTLPSNCLVGDIVTVVRTAGANDLTIDGAGADTVDGQANSKIVGGSIPAFRSFLCIAAGLAWITLEESQNVVETSSNLSVTTGGCRDLVILCHTTSMGSGGNQINLPSTAQPGDRITIVDVDGALRPGHNLRIQTPVGVTLNGETGSIDFFDAFASITIRHVGAGVWVTEARGRHTQPTFPLSNSGTVPRLSGLFTVAVQTNSGLWTDFDTVTLPAAAFVGDIVIVTDAEGAITNESTSVRKEINVVPPGSATINGTTLFKIGGGYGSAAFLYAATDTWVSIAEGMPRNAVYNVFGVSLTLPRIGPNFLVRVNPGGGAWDGSEVITLPTDAVLGDQITICQANTGDSGDQIRVQPGGGSTFNGYLTEYSIPTHQGTFPNVGASAAVTFRKVSATIWMIESQFGPNEIISASNDLNLTRTSANMMVHVNTSAGTWDGTVDRITLPSTGAGGATPGDKITIFDADGVAHIPPKFISVDGGTINGASVFSINWAYGCATFVLETSGTWVATGFGGPGRLLRRTIRTTVGSGTTALLAGTATFRVYGGGPGGGGGGVDGQGAGTAACGACGSSGATFDHVFARVTGVDSYTWEVGGGGSAGTGSGGGNGGNGSGPTQVTYNSVTVGGNAGAGGNGEIASAGFPRIRPPEVNPTVIGSPQIGAQGQQGTPGFVLSETCISSGVGGRSPFGEGGPPRVTNNGSAVAGGNGSHGSGASGAVVGEATTGNANGGAGGDGILIVEEYS